MIRIEAPRVSRRDDRHILSARIRVEKERTYFPDTMWYAVSGDDPEFIPGLSDPFVTVLVAAAMKMGADIRVEGRVSTRLAHGLQTYQTILHTWWPKTFKPVEIDYAELDDRRQDVRPWASVPRGRRYHPVPGIPACACGNNPSTQGVTIQNAAV